MALMLAEWVLLLSGLLVLAVVLGVTAGRYRLPLTGVLAGVGFIAGSVGRTFGVVSPLRGELFNEVVLVLFLPVLIFHAALGMNTRAFVRNIGPILVLAIPALVASALIVGFTLHWELGAGLAAALLFGAIVSATDPVAVVAVFRELHVPARLRTLVEGESLMNDAVAIVLAQIFLVAALGGDVSPVRGVAQFVLAFVGGSAIGVVGAVFAALLLPWLRPLPATALTLGIAYGSFVLSEEVLGFSGVMATAAAGLVLGGLAPSRAPAPVRALWKDLWSALDYVANALLFLLVGLAIDARLLAEYGYAIVIAILAVLAARPVAIVPFVFVVQRVARVPPLSARSLATLVWGGLRGGVALALVLALPEELAEREVFVAMVGAVVLTTLVLNATSIRVVVQHTGLAEPTRADRFLAASAHLSGIAAARKRIRDLRLEAPAVVAALDDAEDRVVRALGRIPLTEAEERKVVTQRGLRVERGTYQHLSDAGILPPPVARKLLNEVDDEIEDLALDPPAGVTRRARRAPLLDRFLEFLVAKLPRPLGENATELAYAEASARRLAARRTAEALALFERLPNVRDAPVRDAKATFARWEEDAIAALRDLDARAGHARDAVHRRQAEALSRIAAEEALRELVNVGLLPHGLALRASRLVEEEAGGSPARS